MECARDVESSRLQPGRCPGQRRCDIPVHGGRQDLGHGPRRIQQLEQCCSSDDECRRRRVGPDNPPALRRESIPDAASRCSRSMAIQILLLRRITMAERSAESPSECSRQQQHVHLRPGSDHLSVHPESAHVVSNPRPPRQSPRISSRRWGVPWTQSRSSWRSTAFSTTDSGPCTIRRRGSLSSPRPCR